VNFNRSPTSPNCSTKPRSSSSRQAATPRISLLQRPEARSALRVQPDQTVVARVASPNAPAKNLRAPLTPGAHSSGSRRIAPYVALRSLLLRYLSPILVETVLSQAMFKRRLSADPLTVSVLRELAPDIMLGLRMFVLESLLPELMVALAELLEQDEP
jgi:hypothetical protein